MNIYVDGGTSNNGMFGFQKSRSVVFSNKVLVDLEIGDKTNNEAELIAMILGIYFRPKKIFSDSQLVVNWANGRWKTKEPRLKPQVDILKHLVSISKPEIIWIPRDKNLAGIYIEEKYGI